MTEMKKPLYPATSGSKESSVISLDRISYGTKDRPHAGSVLSAHNISYKVKVPAKVCGRSVEKEILFDITGVFKPGLTAIMGPTGAGKSTLMDILAARKSSWGNSGHVLLNGKQLPGNFRCMVGYVVQVQKHTLNYMPCKDDVIMGTLTVRENLSFSAALRLPASVKTAERMIRVEDVIKELGLTKCADTKVGTEFSRGVSGGERKRCNVGMELIISPSVLFLDEPTTGLDADTAHTVVMILKRLAKKGRTIIFTIHQPRYSIFCLFDNLLLLSEGYMVYSGPSNDALEFFAAQGFTCPVYNNPPDFFMDVMNGNNEQTNGNSEQTNGNSEQTSCDSEKQEQINRCHEKLVVGFKHSTWNFRLQAEAGDILSRFNTQSGIRELEVNSLKYATSFLHQVRVVAGRSMKNTIRNPVCSALAVVVSVAFAVFIDAIFWDLDKTPVKGLKDRNGILLFLVINQLFLNLTTIDTFTDERRLFTHEHIGGFYRTSSYFVVKVLFDILPMRVISVIITSSLVYFAVGLNPGFDHFLKLTLTLLCVTLAAAAMCFFFSSVCEQGYSARTLMSFTYIIMLLFGGFLVNYGAISSWLRWLQYLSLIKYGLAALYIIEFKGKVFCTANNTLCKTGHDHLIEQEVSFREPWDFWSNHVALITMACIFLVLTYIVLSRQKTK